MANKRQKKKQQSKLKLNVKHEKPSYQFPVGDKTLEVYQREAKNTRQKLRRVQKEFNKDLSQEIKIPNLTEFSSRKEFNKWVQDVQSFRNRANMNYQYDKNSRGFAVSRAERKEVEQNIKTVQERVDAMNEKYEHYPYFVGGKQVGTVGENKKRLKNGSPTGYLRPLDLDLEVIETQKQWDEKKEAMKKKASEEYYDKRQEDMKNNLMEQLEKAFNSDAEDLVTMINNLPTDEFYELYIMNHDFSFEEVYIQKDMDEDSQQDFISQMMDDIEAYYNGEVSMDLKHF